MIMKKIDITANINGIQLPLCIMNASGVLCSTDQELSNLLDSHSGGVVTKSCTSQPRKGNILPRYFEWNMGSINSMGLPNFGIHFYLGFLEEKKINKPIFLSISGLSTEENYYLIQKANQSSKVTAIELNLSCPNLIGKENVFGYNFDKISNFIEKIFKFNKKPLGIKLPPYFQDAHIKNIASILNQFPIFFVTCINSLPNGLFIDANKESVVICPKKGFGGIGGPIIKPFALANIRKFYTYLRKDISIIGCGGISSGKDIFEHILCGASAVQIGTQFMKEGVSVFERLKKELILILEKKNYSSLNNFKGKLKNLQ
ncbi:dihydroorotate oxidase [Blattabacterium cuenoti]|uniref:dihydroorotate oxidase (fumarate) n=1 Tax=Blattabacterium cuenoti STAT TaxID=1457030 RepID=A0A224AI54_9FLAO|nr:dihydroorotate oxidase [Blattabacterium cuenoti]BBA17063.1 dihydroorotate dehydrogenase [Blattabacterium cuenoti STAT]